MGKKYMKIDGEQEQVREFNHFYVKKRYRLSENGNMWERIGILVGKQKNTKMPINTKK